MGEIVLVLECQDIEGKLITSFDNWVVEKASQGFFWEISNWHTPKKNLWCSTSQSHFTYTFYTASSRNVSHAISVHTSICLIHSGQKCLPGWPVYDCCKMPEGGNVGGRGATPTSISIFDSYDMKTLWFEFGLHWLQNANTLNLEVFNFIT